MSNLPKSYAELITDYFREGHTYCIILEYLNIYHDIKISLRKLKRDLNRLGLKRNGSANQISTSSLQEAVSVVQHNTDGRAGYRRTWRIINFERQQRVTQERVRQELLRQDPTSVRRRISRVLTRRAYYAPGPNHVWHVDGYDKLKNYGFPIHGCIDGYSRKILWLKCSLSNNNPKIILHHFLSTLQQLRGCPALLRTDAGTENVLIAAAQRALRNNSSSHIYGTSQHNQRIEAWWSVLRKSWTQIWMDLFDDFRTAGFLNPSNSVHISLLQFCFMEIIQEELNRFVVDWNLHTIRTNRKNNTVGGKPDVLYFLPRLSGSENCLYAVDTADVTSLFAESQPNSELPTLFIRLQHLVVRNNLVKPSSRDAGIDFYLHLFHSLRDN